MTSTEPGPVGVVGAGVMGIGITQCLTASGHPVVVVDHDPAALAAGPGKLRAGLRLSRLLGRSGGAEKPPDSVRWSTDPGDLGDVGFVIECVRENMAVKESVFRELDRHCPPHAVFASCTSAVPVTALAAATGRPQLVLGMHFMNPAPLVETVEVIRTAQTGRHALNRSLALLSALGKKGLVVSDAPGFVSNRVLMLTINEAATVVDEGTAGARRVDEIFQRCFGHPMGPLATADLIGLDTVLDTLEVLRLCTGDTRFDPCPLLVRLVSAGHTGRKGGRGFHPYARSNPAHSPPL